MINIKSFLVDDEFKMKKRKINIRLNHHFLPGSPLTQYFIKKSVNNQSFNFFDNLFVVESSGGW